MGSSLKVRNAKGRDIAAATVSFETDTPITVRRAPSRAVPGRRASSLDTLVTQRRQTTVPVVIRHGQHGPVSIRVTVTTVGKGERSTTRTIVVLPGRDHWPRS
jgi:hypothetical protein